MSNESAQRMRNRILSRLQPEDFKHLSPHLKTVTLPINTILHEAHARIETVCFPLTCVLSAIAMTTDGDGIEVGTVGNEGAEGLTAFIGPSVSPNRVIVQIAGDATFIDAATLAAEAKNNSILYDLLFQHHQAFLAQITQSVACNGLHTLSQRCCRWLLMTHDRVEGDSVALTHEFLALMLAVRRPGVTDALSALEERGLVKAGRGEITITNRAGLETAACDCYRIVVKEYTRLLG
jgi:CRP-like cAMP-binding protein